MTTCLTNRWKRHLKLLKWNKHHSVKLQRSYNKYGVENFTFEKISSHICSLSEIRLIEIKIIKIENSYHDGYNCTEGGDCYTHKLGKLHPLSKPLHQYDLDGNWIKTWESRSLAVGELKKEISVTKSKKPKISHNHIWSYDFYGPLTRRFHKVFKYSLNGLFISSYVNCQHAAKVNKLNSSNIDRCIRGKTKTAYGYQWNSKYCDKICEVIPNNHDKIVKQSGKRIVQYDIYGNLINSFPSLGKAALSVSGNYENISKCCNGHSKTAYGYIWSFEKS